VSILQRPKRGWRARALTKTRNQLLVVPVRLDNFGDRASIATMGKQLFWPIAALSIAGTSPAFAKCDHLFFRANAIFVRAVTHCEKNYMDSPAGYYALAEARECYKGLGQQQVRQLAKKAMLELDAVAKQRGKSAACKWVDSIEKTVVEAARGRTAEESPGGMATSRQSIPTQDHLEKWGRLAEQRHNDEKAGKPWSDDEWNRRVKQVSGDLTINVTGLARSMSQFAAIRGICRNYYEVDRAFLEKLIHAIGETIWNGYGKRAFDEALTTEKPRRDLEIAATGEAQWCAYQRSHMREQKLSVFLN
jgi:hypothetical protein